MMHGGLAAAEQSLVRWHRWAGAADDEETRTEGVTEDSASHVSTPRRSSYRRRTSRCLCKTLVCGISYCQWSLICTHANTRTHTLWTTLYKWSHNVPLRDKTLTHGVLKPSAPIKTSLDWTGECAEQTILWSVHNVSLMKLSLNDALTPLTINKIRVYSSYQA